MPEHEIVGPCCTPYELPSHKPVTAHQIAEGLKSACNKGQALSVCLQALSSFGMLSCLDQETREKVTAWRL